MAQIRCQIITRRATDLAVDHITNVVHFNRSGAWEWLVDGLDVTSIANDVRDVFVAQRQGVPPGYGCEVKVYNVEQAEPRQLMYTAPWTAYQNAAGVPAAREVALCLSFRGDRNLPRKRGRIYLGPFTKSAVDERPADVQRNGAIAIANGLAGIGGVDIDWCVRSGFPVVAGGLGGTMVPVQQAWCDDEWDTVRSRGLKPTLRAIQNLSE